MTPEDDTTTADAGDADANFGAGFSVEAKPENPAPVKAEPAAATPRAEAEPAPEYVNISAKEWADVTAAIKKTAGYEAQLAKAWGTIGGVQRWINGQKEAGKPTPPAAVAKKFEVPKEAFAAMERDFPELAQQTRAALEAALSGIPIAGANDAHDPTKLESLLAQYTAKREIEALEDAFPEWRQIVGAVDATKEQPDPENPFRKWLADKDAAYQARVNGSESAAVIGRAIRTYQKETAAAAKPAATPQRDTARADRIRAAVQPRGDNAGAAPANTSEDAFAAGFGR